MRALFGTLAAGAIMVAGAAQAQDISPAVVFDMGGKFDRSFNQGVYDGVEKFREESGIAYDEFEVTNETQREQALRRMARNGADIVIAVGFAQASSLDIVAQEFPDTKFTIIDGVVEQPNVQSVVFKEHEGSYLVGVLAAMASKTDAVGFIGGMDIPLISKFACGYEQGAKSVNPDIDYFENMTGTTPAAWADPVKGAELANDQFARGADVIYAAAGFTGTGVLQAAEDTGNLAIGVDSNQNYLHPGTVLTSMLKRVDVAAYEAFKTAMDGTWEPGVKVLGLAEEGVGWALDEHNEALISDEMKDAVAEAAEKIVSGEIVVVDYTANEACDF